MPMPADIALHPQGVRLNVARADVLSWINGLSGLVLFRKPLLAGSPGGQGPDVILAADDGVSRLAETPAYLAVDEADLEMLLALLMSAYLADGPLALSVLEARLDLGETAGSLAFSIA